MTVWFRRHGRTMVVLFFLALIAVGLVTVPDYGSAWDEKGEIGILRMSLKEYADILPIDTPYRRALTEMGIVPISQSIERDHGICSYYPLFWAVCRTDVSVRQVSLLWRGYTWLLFCLGAYSLYALARGMGLSRPLACIAVLMLAFSPRIFAEAHYNNKDIALLSLSLLAMWQTLRLWQKPTVSRGLLFALAAGFCSGTRVIGIAVCGLCGLVVVVRLAQSKQLSRNIVRVGLVTVFATLLCYVALTPAFLKDPLGFPVYLVKNAIGFSRWHGTVLFNGSLVFTATEKLPQLYLPVMIALTTPVWLLVMLLIGQSTAVARAIRRGKTWLMSNEGGLAALASLLWLLPLIAAVMARMLLYNGWRHFYFIAGPMTLLMAYGMGQLWAWAHRRSAPRVALASALALCLGWQCIGLWRNHPYQYGYYNLLIPHNHLEQRFELDYWNLSCADALRQLMREHPGETLRVAPSDHSTRSGLIIAVEYLGTDRIVVEEKTTDADYVLANMMYACISKQTVSDASQWLVETRSYGVPMSVIYAAASLSTQP